MSVYYEANENQKVIDELNEQISEIENQIYKLRWLQEELFQKRNRYLPKLLNNAAFGPRHE